MLLKAKEKFLSAGAGQGFKLFQISHGLCRSAAAHLPVRSEIIAYLGPMRAAKQLASVIFRKLYATDTGGLPGLHSGNGRGKGYGDAARTAAWTTIHKNLPFSPTYKKHVSDPLCNPYWLKKASPVLGTNEAFV